MRKFLLLTFFCFLFIGGYAQVTQINADHTLQPVGKLNNTLSLFESDIDSSLWVSDGTLAGTVPITDTIKVDYLLIPGLGGGIFMNGKFIFKGISPQCGREIFITDGTKAGTKLIKDINPGTANSQTRSTSMATLGGYVYFAAVTPTEGCELWRTDGTAANTSIVKDIVSGSGSGIDSINFSIVALNNKILFTAQTAASGNELWSTDGTDVNTSMIQDIIPGATSSFPTGFYYFNNMDLFTTVSQASGYVALWRTDGKSTGTFLLKDNIPNGFWNTFHTFNNRVYFMMYDEANFSDALWNTDGVDATAAHTSLIKDLDASYDYSATTVDNLLSEAINLPDKFIFPFTDELDIHQLWESDGSAGGTTIFNSLPPDPTESTPVIFSNPIYDPSSQTITYPLYNGNFYFSLQNLYSTGKELWMSDGTIGNTNLVEDINPGTADGIVDENWLYTTSGLFFAADDGVHGNELWKTDGVTTSMVKDIFPGGQSSDPQLCFVNNNKVFFVAIDGGVPDSSHWGLYVVDGNFSVLPVKLLDFTVTPKSADALLQWSTASETNSKNFVVQSSDDAMHWKTIGTVPAAGNSSLQKDYSFTDVGIMNSGKSIVYYRLLQTDIDGNSTYSNIIELTINNNNQWNVQLYSNPVQGQLKLMLTGVIGNTSLLINDMSGRIIYNSQLQNQNGLVTIPINLPPGVYVLKVMANNGEKAIKFVKE